MQLESKHCRSFKDAHDHVNYWYLHKSSETNVQMVGSSEVHHLQKVGERKQSCGGKKVQVQKNCRFSVSGPCALGLVCEALQVLRWSLCIFLGSWSSSGVEMVFVHLACSMKLFRCWNCCALGFPVMLLASGIEMVVHLASWSSSSPHKVLESPPRQSSHFLDGF